MSDQANALIRYFGLIVERARFDKGGQGSGFFGHAGRPGQRGGSAAAGGAAFSGATIEEFGTNFSWQSEDTITGRATITGLNGEPSEAEVEAYLREHLPGQVDLVGIKSSADIEELSITSYDFQGDYAVVEVDITPTVDAGERWMESAGGAEEWGLYHGQ